MKPSDLTKRQWKICEAVHLGIDHYYMEDSRDRHEITDDEYAKALDYLSKLPSGWMQEPQEWMKFK